MPGRIADTITNPGNPQIVEVRKLDQRKHREEQGRFLVEGLQLLTMALDAGAEPLDVFYAEELFTGQQAPALVERFSRSPARLLPVAPRVMERLSERDAPQGIVATFRLYEKSLGDLSLSGRELVVVLDRLQDPGNAGTLIRTADAAGAAAIVMLEPCVDPFDPKTVRGTMGSLFNVPLVRTGDPRQLAEWLRGRGFRLVGAAAHEGVLWGDGLWKGGVALVLGNEARGLSPDVAEQVGEWVRLPMVGKAESLNVAIAGGILMYAWLRENSGG